MAAYNCELRQNTGSAFADILYLKTIPAMVDGLLVGGKIADNLLPSYVFGGMRFAGTLSASIALSANPTTGTVAALLSAYLASNGGSPIGVYWVATADIAVTSYYGGATYPSFSWRGVSEEETTPDDPVFAITLEKGDWLICVDTGTSEGQDVFFFSVINNTYRMASGAVSGLMSSAHYTKLEGIAANANNYSHPTQTAIDVNATDNGINVIDRVVVNTLGHVTQVVTRDLAAATISTPGHMTAAQATKLAGLSNYSHPTDGANVVMDAGANETIDSVTVDIQGHVTAFTKQTIRSASTSQTGLVELATIEEMKAGTSATLVGAAASVKAAIDFFATLPVYASLTAANTDAPNQPTGKLALVIV
jgi:3,4-dihydroxy-2-butanone 4-phosphate synthase